LFIKNQDGRYRLINTSRYFVLGATGKYRYVSDYEGCKDTVDFKIQRGLPFVHDIPPVNPHFCNQITLTSFDAPVDVLKEWIKITSSGEHVKIGEGNSITLTDSATVILKTTAYDGCSDTSQVVNVYKLPYKQAFIFEDSIKRLCDNEIYTLRSNFPAYWFLLN
jgi:hypothetical protein